MSDWKAGDKAMVEAAMGEECILARAVERRGHETGWVLCDRDWRPAHGWLDTLDG